MAEPPPDDKDKQTPPPPRDFKIMIEDSTLPDDMKAIMLEQHEQNKEMRKTIQEMNTREQLGLRDTQVAQLLTELGEIRPDLVEEFKDEKDLGRLKDAIKVAKKLTSKFPEVKLDKDGKVIKPPTVYTSIDPITRKPRADSA